MCRFFMTKYNKLFKQQVIEFYPQNGKNRSLTHRQFQLKDTTLCRWISKYNHNGINELEVVSKNQNEGLKPCSIRL